MGTQKSLNLDDFVHDRCYFKSETRTRSEITSEITSTCYTKSETRTRQEITDEINDKISKLVLVEYVTALPTTNIKSNRLYIVPNNENPSIDQNLYDIYIRYNDKWEQIDSLEFNIADYYTKTEADNTFSVLGHVHSTAVANTTDGFISKTDQAKIDSIETGANKTTIDTSITSNGTNPVTGKAIYDELATKSHIDHRHDNAAAPVDGEGGNDGFLSKEDKEKLDGVAIQATRNIVDSNIIVSGTNPVQGRAIYNALQDKAPADHDHSDLYYDKETVDTKFDEFIGEDGEIHLQNYYTKTETRAITDTKISSITIDDDLILEIKYQ